MNRHISRSIRLLAVAVLFGLSATIHASEMTGPLEESYLPLDVAASSIDSWSDLIEAEEAEFRAALSGSATGSLTLSSTLTDPSLQSLIIGFINDLGITLDDFILELFASGSLQGDILVALGAHNQMLDCDPAPVPEPSSVLCFALALGAMAFYGRSKVRAKKAQA